jgi:GTPase SAR1 family protein
MTSRRRAHSASKPLVPATTKDAVSKIFAEFKPSRRFREANEARTRIEVINRVLATFGWLDKDIEPEAPSGTGEFLDYELWAQDQPWMVVEAKRAGLTFDLSDAGTKKNDSRLRTIASLNNQGGATFREAMKQAATYCNDKGIPLACVTNGFQWLFFRGLSSKHRAWTAGSALVFATSDEVIARFDDFLRSLGRTWAGTTYLHELLDRPHSGSLPAPRVPRDFFATRRAQVDPDRIAVLRSVSDYLLGDIYGEDRREMLNRCYVTPGVAGEFERSIERLLKDAPHGLDDEPHDVVEGDPGTFVSTLSKQAQLSQIRHPVVVVGHVGVGKTTFLQRSLAHLRDDKSAFCALVDLEGHGHGGTVDASHEEDRVAQLILDKLTNAATTVLKDHGVSTGELAQADPNEAVTLRTLLRERITQERALGEKVWRADPAAWDRREYEIFSELRANPVALLTRYTRHLRGRFKSYPVLIILDNLDQAHEDYQRCIYGFAQRLSRETPAVVVVCIREDTYKTGREDEGFLSSSPLHFVFHVARPPLDKLLRQRVQFGEAAASSGELPRRLRAEAVAVRGVCDLLRKTVLVQPSESLNVFAALAGPNMRDALGLVRGLVEGAPAAISRPEPSTAFAFECLLISQGQSGLKTRCRIANCFDAEPSDPPFHALRIRLLAYLAWAFDSVAERAFLEGTERALGHFAAWGYPVALTRRAISQLLDDGLVAPIDGEHAADGHTLPRRVRISASGYVHLTRLSVLPTYRAAMACLTNWYDGDLVDGFIKQSIQAGGEQGVTIGDIAASPALGFFESYLATAVAREDTRLSEAIEKHPWIGEVRARAAAVSAAARLKSDPPAPPFSLTSALVIPPLAPSAERLPPVASQPPSPPLTPNGSSLPTIRRERSYHGTTWIPRILWALEWAKMNNLGPQTPADIARILKAYGEIDVPRNNVARAFRDLRGKEVVAGLWRGIAKRYVIDNGGSILLRTLLEEDQSVSHPSGGGKKIQ